MCMYIVTRIAERPDTVYYFNETIVTYLYNGYVREDELNTRK